MGLYSYNECSPLKIVDPQNSQNGFNGSFIPSGVIEFRRKAKKKNMKRSETNFEAIKISDRFLLTVVKLQYAHWEL